VIGCEQQKSGEVNTKPDDPKIVQLLEANAKLNRALSRKDWDRMYTMMRETKEAGLPCRGFTAKEDFIRECREVFSWGFYRIKTLGYTVDFTKARTANLVRGRLILAPWKAYQDTMYHDWQHQNNRWYIIAWGYIETPEIPHQPDDRIDSLLQMSEQRAEEILRKQTQEDESTE